MTKDTRNKLFVFAVIAAASLILAVVFSHIAPLPLAAGVSDISQQYIHLFLKKSVPRFKLAAIEVDDYTLKMMPRWPWKRSVYADLIRNLDAEGCRSIGFDFIFAGDSEDRKQDQILAEAIHSASCPVVIGIGYTQEDGRDELLLPPQPILESGCLPGLVNTPAGGRRVRSSVVIDGRVLYSFTLQNAAAAVNMPAPLLEKSIERSLDRVKTFPVNFFVGPEDREFVRVSFLEALRGMDGLKKRYGGEFLRNAVVVVYSSAELEHDFHASPIGKIPGGLLHVNGILTILSDRIPRRFFLLDAGLVLAAACGIGFFLLTSGFITGLVMAGGMLIVFLWLSVAAGLNGILLDLPLVSFFSAGFFVSGSVYKYLVSLTHLLRIKNKLTCDPVRGIFTMRYFYYRADFESGRMYFFRKLFLVFVSLKGFGEETRDMGVESMRSVWKEISAVIGSGRSFWATYSSSELIGGIRCRPSEIDSLARHLKNSLEIVLKEHQVKAGVKTAWIEMPRSRSLKEVLHVLFNYLGEWQSPRGEEALAFTPGHLKELLPAGDLSGRSNVSVLDSLDDDIEERNRQLLSLVERLSREYARSKDIFFQVITSLVNALEARDPYTQGHSDRVCRYALGLADTLGWNKEDKEKLAKAAMLHDLGKIGIPDGILHKPGKLTDEEFDFIKKHEIIAVRILEPITELKDILPWIMYHHERWDGKGYPHGLAGNSIPAASQIISIADVFDALTTGRDYKAAMSVDESIKEIVRNKGVQFNPELVDMFVGVVTFASGGQPAPGIAAPGN